jgi:hypothetical protein
VLSTGNQQYPGAQHRNQQYPGAQHRNQQYPGAQHRNQQHSGCSAPGTNSNRAAKPWEPSIQGAQHHEPDPYTKLSEGPIRIRIRNKQFRILTVIVSRDEYFVAYNIKQLLSVLGLIVFKNFCFLVVEIIKYKVLSFPL